MAKRWSVSVSLLFVMSLLPCLVFGQECKLCKNPPGSGLSKAIASVPLVGKVSTVAAVPVSAVQRVVNRDASSRATPWGFAGQLNQEGVLRHDSGSRRAEVVYYSSGRATRRGAVQAWRNSPGHNRILNSGRVRVRCRGNYCVGRRTLFGR